MGELHLTVADVCQSYGASGLAATIEIFALAAELKNFNGVEAWTAQQFLDQATSGRGAQLRSEYSTMPLGTLLQLIATDLRAHPELGWQDPL